MRNQSNTACNTCAVVQHKCTYISLFLSFPFAQSLSVNTVGNRSGKTLNLVPFFPPIHKRTHTYIMRLWFASFAWGLNFKSVDVSIFSPRMITCVFLHVCVTHSTKCTFDQAVVIDTYFVPVSACGWLLWHSVNTIISTESQCHWSRSRAIGMLWPPENFHIGEQSLQQDWSCSNGWTDGWKNKINDGTNVISDVLCLFTTVFLSNELRDCSPASHYTHVKGGHFVTESLVMRLGISDFSVPFCLPPTVHYSLQGKLESHIPLFISSVYGTL